MIQTYGQVSYQNKLRRAFIAWEEGVIVDSSKEHKLRANLQDYKAKLTIHGNSLPDPFTLVDGWVSEADKHLWPSLYFCDLAVYLKEKTPQDLYKKLCNEYKQGKGYRYFSAGSVKEVFYHPIRDDITVAVLSGCVAPSMKTSIPDYQVWVIIDKDTRKAPGGLIHSAYCTCPVGLHGSCNHIAGLLFRIEYAVRSGLTSCTSNACTWKQPSNLRTGKPVRLIDMSWKRDQYFHQDRAEDHEASVRQLVTEFSPLSKSDEQYSNQANRVITDIANIMREEQPNCCFMQLVDKKKYPRKPKQVCPPSLLELAKLVDTSSDNQDEQVQELFQSLVFNDSEFEAVEVTTRSQSSCLQWKEQKAGRVTASNMKRVFTRTESLRKDPQQDASALVKVIMEYSDVELKTLAIKHGNSMEPHAKKLYTRLQKKSHKGFISRDSGLVIYRPQPFIAASPDLVVSCTCCGVGVCEIKCPYVCRDESPSAENWPHLFLDEHDGCVKLVESSQYMYQVQGQMACMGVSYADFFVYTAHGYHLQRVIFNAALWAKMEERFTWFWRCHIAPEALTGSMHDRNTCPQVAQSDHLYAAKSTTSTSTCLFPPLVSKKTILTAPRQPLVFLCGTCGIDCVDNPISFVDNSIECSRCKMWFHFGCLDWRPNQPDVIPENSDIWVCSACSN